MAPPEWIDCLLYGSPKGYEKVIIAMYRVALILLLAVVVAILMDFLTMR